MTNKNVISIEENLYITLILCFIGGFFDAYTYILYDKIFANTQTGNLIFFTIYFLEREYYNAILRIFPLISFCIAIFMTQLLMHKFNNKKIWLKIILIINILLTFIIGFGFFKDYRMINITLISFICANMLGCFKKSNGYIFAPIMCTGNLRSLMEFFSLWVINKEENAKNVALNYFFIIFSFCLGIALGVIIVKFFDIYSMFVCTVLYLIVFLVIYLKTK